MIRYQTGSRVYGTALDDSDIDIIEVYVPSAADMILGHYKNTQKIADEDKNKYPLTNFVHMLAKGNPNVFPYLFTPPQYIEEEDKLVKWIRMRPQWFVSQRAVKAMLGMAKQQVEDMHTGVTGKMGERRKLLVAEHAFDVKAAYHAVRIAAMASELAETGKMLVDRRNFDAHFLVQIRLGQETAQSVEWWVDNFVKKAQFFMENLTPDPEYDTINGALVDTVKKYWRYNGEI